MVGSHNLTRLAEESFARNGDYESLWFEGRWYRSGELLERAGRIAGGLQELGVQPGDRVVVMAGNSPAVPVVYNAIWRAGAVVTPVIFLTPPAELEHILASCEPKLVIASPEFGIEGVSIDDLPEADPAPIVERADDELAALMYTGGTTGRAKGVMLTHENLWRTGKAGHEAGYLPEIVRGLIALPLSHSYGLLVTVVGFHSPQRSATVLMRWFEPRSFLELAQLELREGYGLTETSALVSSNRPGRVKVGTVGPPVPGCEVRIVADEDRELSRGEVGEICVRSPFVMRGYWRDEQLTAEATRGGWFHTGDLGKLDEDGYLTIVDRKKDLIIRGGFNVFPRDVEDALLEHPAVALAGVVGRPDERHGEEVVAFVSLRPGVETTVGDLVAFAKERIGGYKYPREVRILPDIPLTPVGKVDRKSLRAML